MQLNKHACWAALATALLLASRPAFGHFLWITVDPAETTKGHATFHLFLNEPPEPGGPEFLKFAQGVTPTVDGLPLPVVVGDETVDAQWVGKRPAMIDVAKDLGVRTKEQTSYRIYYTARAQSEPARLSDKETGDMLRVRLVTRDGKPMVQVLFNGKVAAKARIKTYPQTGDSLTLTADDQGLAAVEGLAEGKTGLWANWTEAKVGEVGGKSFTETRYYATLTYRSQAIENSADPKRMPTTFATMPAPAVNSFGGAVLGDWLYVYSGHVGRTHRYSLETTAKHFRRLNLKDRTTWEDLPMRRDVQGVAMVSDGHFVYRIGGMSARNKPGEEHDLVSVADFSRFDPATKTWTDLTPLPQPRSTHDAVIIGRSIYVVGGWTMKGAEDESTYLHDAVVFDLENPKAGWRPIPQPFRRRALSAAEAGGKLYVLGGLNSGSEVERRVDVYDPKTDAWTTGPDLPGKRKADGFGTSSFGVDGRIYFSGAAGRIFRLAPECDSWELLGAWSLPRITHRLLPGPDHSILAVGGNGKGEQTPVIEAVYPALIKPKSSVNTGD